MKSELEKFKLGYEETPSSTLTKKIKERFNSFKLKPIRGGYVAQIRTRMPPEFERKEISEIANTEKDAISKLDQRLSQLGLYDV